MNYRTLLILLSAAIEYVNAITAERSLINGRLAGRVQLSGTFVDLQQSNVISCNSQTLQLKVNSLKVNQVVLLPTGCGGYPVRVASLSGQSATIDSKFDLLPSTSDIKYIVSFSNVELFITKVVDDASFNAWTLQRQSVAMNTQRPADLDFFKLQTAQHDQFEFMTGVSQCPVQGMKASASLASRQNVQAWVDFGVRLEGSLKPAAPPKRYYYFRQQTTVKKQLALEGCFTGRKLTVFMRDGQAGTLFEFPGLVKIDYSRSANWFSNWDTSIAASASYDCSNTLDDRIASFICTDTGCKGSVSRVGSGVLPTGTFTLGGRKYMKGTIWSGAEIKYEFSPIVFNGQFADYSGTIRYNVDQRASLDASAEALGSPVSVQLYVEYYPVNSAVINAVDSQPDAATLNGGSVTNAIINNVLKVDSSATANIGLRGSADALLNLENDPIFQVDGDCTSAETGSDGVTSTWFLKLSCKTSAEACQKRFGRLRLVLLPVRCGGFPARIAPSGLLTLNGAYQLKVDVNFSSAPPSDSTNTADANVEFVIDYSNNPKAFDARSGLNLFQPLQSGQALRKRGLGAVYEKFKETVKRLANEELTVNNKQTFEASKRFGPFVLFDQTYEKTCPTSAGLLQQAAYAYSTATFDVNADVEFGIKIVAKLFPVFQVSDAYVYVKAGLSIVSTFTLDASFSASFTGNPIPLINLPITPLTIPGLLTIGPNLHVDLLITAGIDIFASLQYTVSKELARVQIIGGLVDGQPVVPEVQSIDQWHSQKIGIKPQSAINITGPGRSKASQLLASQFSASGFIGLHLRPSLIVGIDSPVKMFNAKIGLRGQASLILAAAANANLIAAVNVGDVNGKRSGVKVGASLWLELAYELALIPFTQFLSKESLFASLALSTGRQTIFSTEFSWNKGGAGASGSVVGPSKLPGVITLPSGSSGGGDSGGGSVSAASRRISKRQSSSKFSLGSALQCLNVQNDNSTTIADPCASSGLRKRDLNSDTNAYCTIQNQIRSLLSKLPTLAEAEAAFAKAGMKNAASAKAQFIKWLNQCSNTFFKPATLLQLKQRKLQNDWYNKCVVQNFDLLTFAELRIHFQKMASEMKAYRLKNPGKTCLIVSPELRKEGLPKSEDWFASVLTREFGVKVDCFVDYELFKTAQDGSIKHVFVTDDTSYSGTQLTLNLGRMISSAGVGVFVPRFSRMGNEMLSAELSYSGDKMYLYRGSRVVNGMSRQCINDFKLVPGVGSNVDSVMSFRFPKMEEQGLMVMQYKIPDSLSLDPPLAVCLRQQFQIFMNGMARGYISSRFPNDPIFYRLMMKQ